MKKFRLLITICLAVLAGLACGVDHVSAQTPADAKSQHVLVTSQPHAPPPYQRRQEAKKRFKEALEARKAQRVSVGVLPEKIAPNRGGRK